MFLAIIAGVLALGACGGDEEGATDTGEPIVVQTRVVIATEEGADVIATGVVLGESMLGGSPFCADGTILDSHGSSDPQVLLIARTVTCPDGTVRIDLRPEVAPGQTQTGAWAIVGGTGEFEGLRGSGTMEVLYGADEDSPARETLTGTVTR